MNGQVYATQPVYNSGLEQPLSDSKLRGSDSRKAALSSTLALILGATSLIGGSLAAWRHSSNEILSQHEQMVSQMADAWNSDKYVLFRQYSQDLSDYLQAQRRNKDPFVSDSRLTKLEADYNLAKKSLLSSSSRKR